MDYGKLLSFEREVCGRLYLKIGKAADKGWIIGRETHDQPAFCQSLQVPLLSVMTRYQYPYFAADQAGIVNPVVSDQFVGQDLKPLF